jgi:hypothetical protein
MATTMMDEGPIADSRSRRFRFMVVTATWVMSTSSILSGCGRSKTSIFQHVSDVIVTVTVTVAVET